MSLKDLLMFVFNSLCNGSLRTDRLKVLIWDAERADYVAANGCQFDGEMNLRIYRDWDKCDGDHAAPECNAANCWHKDPPHVCDSDCDEYPGTCEVFKRQVGHPGYTDAACDKDCTSERHSTACVHFRRTV